MKDLKSLVKGKTAKFVFYRDRALHYQIDDEFVFPVPIEDAGSATFRSEEKALLLMRYIRKHLKALEEARKQPPAA
ncbi:MAG: hypothetical protein AAGA23_12015 [Pseudomonadota bacterium]